MNHSAADRVMAVVDEMDRLGMFPEPALHNAIADWLRREAHLLTVRWYDLQSLGVPAEAAEFVAQDDPGWQLAWSAACATGLLVK